MTLDRDGRTGLHLGALHNDPGTAKVLITSGADVNARDKLGNTPLHFAAQVWSIDVAQLLIDSGADVDAPNKYGNTPLMVAVFNSKGRGEMIRLLRSAGADPRRTNTSGQTAVGLARLIANYDVRRFFVDLD